MDFKNRYDKEEKKIIKEGMMEKKYPKFEKVDAHTIKIIVEKADAVPLSQLISNREQLLEQKKMIEDTLKNIEEIIENATKLGITPEAKDKNPKKE